MAKRARFDRETRAFVWKRIRDLYADGHLPLTIAKILDQEGVRQPNGEKLSPRYVPLSIHYMRTKGMMPSNTNTKATLMRKVTNRPHDRLPSTVVGILTDPDLNSTQQINMLRAYANL